MWEKIKKYIIAGWLALTTVIMLIIFLVIKIFSKKTKMTDLTQEGIKNAEKNSNKIVDEYNDYIRKRMRIIGDKKQ